MNLLSAMAPCMTLVLSIRGLNSDSLIYLCTTVGGGRLIVVAGAGRISASQNEVVKREKILFWDNGMLPSLVVLPSVGELDGRHTIDRLPRVVAYFLGGRGISCNSVDCVGGFG